MQRIGVVSGRVVTVTHTSGEGRATSYRVERLDDGGVRRTVTAVGDPSTTADDQVTTTLAGTDGVTTVTRPDGTVTRTSFPEYFSISITLDLRCEYPCPRHGNPGLPYPLYRVDSPLIGHHRPGDSTSPHITITFRSFHEHWHSSTR